MVVVVSSLGSGEVVQYHFAFKLHTFYGYPSLALFLQFLVLLDLFWMPFQYRKHTETEYNFDRNAITEKDQS